MGLDYALDLISEMEIVPTFPVCKSFFLFSSNNFKLNQKRKTLNSNNINAHKFDFTENWFFETTHTPNTSKNSVESPSKGIAGQIKGYSINYDMQVLNGNQKPEVFVKSKRHFSLKKKPPTLNKVLKQKFHYHFEPDQATLTKLVDSSSELSMISGNISNVGFNKRAIGCSSTMVNSNHIKQETLKTEKRPSQKLHRTPSSRFNTNRSKNSEILRKAKSRNEHLVSDSVEDGMKIADKAKTKKRSPKKSIYSRKMKEQVNCGHKKNTIRSIPIPTNKSEVDAFLDDIFNRALDSSQVKSNRATASKIKHKIKGGVKNEDTIGVWELELKKAEIGLAKKIKGGGQKSCGNDLNYYSQILSTSEQIKEKTVLGSNEAQMMCLNDYSEMIQIASPTSQCVLKQLKLPKSDIQARAKTVRIGKVRWPPPIKESELFENEIQR